MIQLIQLSEKDLETIVNKAVDESFEKNRTNFKKKEPDEWLTRKDVAEMLSVTFVTLDSWAKVGILPKYKIGYAVRYRRSHVEAAMIKVK